MLIKCIRKRRRPDQRKHKGDSWARLNSTELSLGLRPYEDRSRYNGLAVRVARSKNGVGRPPAVRLRQLAMIEANRAIEKLGADLAMTAIYGSVRPWQS